MSRLSLIKVRCSVQQLSVATFNSKLGGWPVIKSFWDWVFIQDWNLKHNKKRPQTLRNFCTVIH